MAQFSFSLFKKLLTPSFFVGLAVIVYGVYYFNSRWEYSENGHGIIFTLYFLCALLFSYAISKRGFILSTLTTISLIFIITYAGDKFQWRQDFITEAQKNNFPAIEQYIDRYPLYEEHHFASFLEKPKWLNFSTECYEPALKGGNMGVHCQSITLIRDHYNIDVMDMINAHYTKMRRTAQRLQNGQIKGKVAYQTCLQNKECAFIPLLPANANIEAISERSKDHIDIRRQFWSLINNETIQPETCEFMDLCRVMQNASVIQIRRSS